MNPAVRKLLGEELNPVLEHAFIMAVNSRRLLLGSALPPALEVPALLLHAIAQEWLERPMLQDAPLVARKIQTRIREEEIPNAEILSATVFQGLPLGQCPAAMFVVNAYKELTGAFA